MLKNKLNRYAIALATLVLASILLYPTTQAGWIPVNWLLLGSVALAAFLTLLTK